MTDLTPEQAALVCDRAVADFLRIAPEDVLDLPCHKYDDALNAAHAWAVAQRMLREGQP